MRWAGHVVRKGGWEILAQDTEEEGQFVEYVHIWGDNIQMNCKEVRTWRHGLDSIDAGYSAMSGFLNTVMNLQVPWKAGNLFTIRLITASVTGLSCVKLEFIQRAVLTCWLFKLREIFSHEIDLPLFSGKKSLMTNSISWGRNQIQLSNHHVLVRISKYGQSPGNR